ncbi:MAG: AraC family transcriptional regulator [Polyangiaceae bacterium]
MNRTLSLNEISSVAQDSDLDALEQTGIRAISSLTDTPPAPRQPILPATFARLQIARARICEAARAGQRIRTYEVALDLDMSEFHFARQFRLAYDRSPHVYYDEVRADSARKMLAAGLSEGVVARRIGFRRPAELRALLEKRTTVLPPELA